MDLERLKELCDRASPGPWEPRVSTITLGRKQQGSAHGPVHLENANQKARYDAEFIAAAREALPELIARIELLHIILSVAAHELSDCHGLLNKEPK